MRSGLGIVGMEQRGRAWWRARWQGRAATGEGKGGNEREIKAGVSQRESVWTLKRMLGGVCSTVFVFGFVLVLVHAIVKVLCS
jgi:hypothetical protein